MKFSTILGLGRRLPKDLAANPNPQAPVAILLYKRTEQLSVRKF